MLSTSLHILLFSSTLMLGTMITISSNSWMIMWMGLELNLLSFLPMMMSPSSNQETEATMKYFLAQAIASALIISMMLIYCFTKETILSNYSTMMMLILGLLMKLGMVPCHWWFPTVMSKLSWTMGLVLMTWQKVAPMFILLSLTMNMMNHLLFYTIAAGAMTGGMMGLNQTKLRPLLAYSSITHMSWTLAANTVSYTVSMLYFFLYIMVTTSLILFIKMNYTDSCNLLSWKTTSMPTTMMMSVLLLSMGGLPPFLGFIPKLLTFEVLMSQHLFGLTFFILLGALMNLSYYMNIVFNLLCPPHMAKKTHQNLLMNILLMVTTTCPFMLLSPFMM